MPCLPPPRFWRLVPPHPRRTTAVGTLAAGRSDAGAARRSSGRNQAGTGRSQAGSGRSQSGTGSGGGKPAASDAERTRSAQSKLAYALIEQLDKNKKPGDNVVVSPASLALVLALVDLGADEKLRVAIHRTLGFDPGTGASAPPAAAKAARGKTQSPPPRRRLSEVNKDAAAELRRLRDTIVELRGDKTLAEVFAIANMFVFDPASPPIESAEIALKAKGAEVRIEPCRTRRPSSASTNGSPSRPRD